MSGAAPPPPPFAGRKVRVYFEPRRNRWLAVERRGDVVYAHAHHNEEGARRLAGLPPRREEK